MSPANKFFINAPKGQFDANIDSPHHGFRSREWPDGIETGEIIQPDELSGSHPSVFRLHSGQLIAYAPAGWRVGGN
jgi:hypothetical protein